MADPQLVRHPVAPQLRGLVAGIVGFDERADDVVERRQPAGTLLPLIVSFGDPLEVVRLSDGAGEGTYSSFVVGIMPGHATTRFSGTQRCVQVYLTPRGAYRLLGLPGREIARHVVVLEEVAPRLGGSLPSRLESVATWDPRFELVEQALLEMVDGGGEPEPLVTWLWGQLLRTGGRARIDELVARTGWSHRHVTSRFHAQVGITPKAAAGIIRFERVMAALGSGPLAELAAEHRYADQSHLTRDVVRYSGDPPRALLSAMRPTAYTALGTLPG